MPVHSLHIFDRKGKTLFTKRFIKETSNENVDPEQLSEQRKLVFGMLFSLREVAAILSPEQESSSSSNNNNKDTGLHSVKTGSMTLYNYETNSGLRFALYVANNNPNATNNNNTGTSDNKSTGADDSITVVSGGTTGTNAATPDTSVRAALQYIYNELWIQCVTRSPLYRPTQPNVQETNFESKLTSFLRAQPWFR